MKYPILNILHLEGTEYSEVRRQNFMKQVEEQQILDYKVWPGIYDAGIPKRGISRSHKQIIADAKERKLPFVCVMEDDVAFFQKGAFDFFIKNIPIHWDIYLGSLSNGRPDKHGVVEWFRGMSLYMIRKDFYDVFLSLDERKDIDVALSQKGLYRVCPDIVCYQIDGYSYHKKAMTKYSRLANQYKKYSCEKK